MSQCERMCAWCRELCSLIGVVKLVFVTICGHMEAAARKACVLQLSPPAMLDVCTVMHHFLSRPERALAGGTKQPEIDLLARVATDIIPESPDWFLSLVGARCLHTVGLWKRCQDQVWDLHSTAPSFWPLGTVCHKMANFLTRGSSSSLQPWSQCIMDTNPD